MPETVYTYRGGVKIALTKQPDAFVVRASPERVRDLGIAHAEPVSPGSTRVETPPAELETLMSRSRAVAPTHHAYTLGDTSQEFLITDRVFVTFKEPLAATQVAEFAGRYALRQLEVYSDRDYLFEVTTHTGMNPIKLVVKLTEEDPWVAAAENDLNYRARKQALTLPTDPAYARQWHLHGHFHHPQVDARAHARCEAAWQRLDHFGLRDIVVGITDDGCKLDHPDFDSPGKFAHWAYFQGNTLVTRDTLGAQPARMYQTGADHGTSCAGVAGGEVDAVFTVGAAPGCRLLPIKWESDGPYLLISDSKLRTALDFVADKIDVLSNSWGHVPMNLTSTVVVNRIAELARTGGRRGRGILFLWAAGNENCPIQHDAAVLTPYTSGWEFRGSWQWVGVERTRTFRNNLAGVPGVLHIAALASTAQRSHYSNYGTHLALCAPSSNSHAYARLRLDGLGITTTTGTGNRWTDEFGGTSSATPLVAGIAALVLSANPALTALELAALLKRTAAKDLNLAGYPRTPAASYDPQPTWDVSPIAPFDQGDFQDLGLPEGTWSPWFGHGRVDAAAAVDAALAAAGEPDDTGGGGTVPSPEPVPPHQRVSRPGLAIPDNRADGIRDEIRVAETGHLNFVRVTVDIPHTFIGDLRVTLQAPSGKAVVLHDRHGGSASNLQRVYDATSTPALRTLDGESVQGAWTLWVQDLAPADRGRLERWELELGFATVDVVEAREAPGTTIPDNVAAGIVRTLTLSGPGRISDVEVTVDITHTYIGDLTVALHSPTNRVVDLHRRAGGSADNLLATYSSTNLAALAGLRGEPFAGAWRLLVADHAAVDVGKLNRWGLRIVQAVTPGTPIAGRKRPARKAAATKRTTSRRAPPGTRRAKR